MEIRIEVPSQAPAQTVACTDRPNLIGVRQGGPRDISFFGNLRSLSVHGRLVILRHIVRIERRDVCLHMFLGRSLASERTLESRNILFIDSHMDSSRILANGILLRRIYTPSLTDSHPLLGGNPSLMLPSFSAVKVCSRLTRFGESATP